MGQVNGEGEWLKFIRDGEGGRITKATSEQRSELWDLLMEIDNSNNLLTAIILESSWILDSVQFCGSYLNPVYDLCTTT